MRIDKKKIVEGEFDDVMVDSDLDMDIDMDSDFDDSMEFGMQDSMSSEIEMVLAEPSKLVDADGSVVLVGPGDIVNIKSESLKRLNKSLSIKEEEDDEEEDDGKPKSADNYKDE